MDVDAIDAALEKMTPGPWGKDYGGTLGHIKSVAQRDDAKTPTVLRYDVDTLSLSEEQKEANAEGIVLLRNSAREMIAEIRRLRELCGEAADNLRDAYDAYRPFYLGEIKDRLQAASKGEL